MIRLWQYTSQLPWKLVKLENGVMPLFRLMFTFVTCSLKVNCRFSVLIESIPNILNIDSQLQLRCDICQMIVYVTKILYVRCRHEVDVEFSKRNYGGGAWE